jgi:hypothetical protein
VTSRIAPALGRRISSHDIRDPGAGTRAALGRVSLEKGDIPMKKMLSMFALVLSASFVAGCALAPEDTEEQQVGSEEVRSEEVASSESALTAPQSTLTSCPPAGLCTRADQFCMQTDNPARSWCDILTRCYACGWPDGEI